MSATGHAEVSFPKTRDVIGVDEYYLLEDFGNWRAECLRDKNDEDFCVATTTTSDLDSKIELDFSITSFYNHKIEINEDVNTVSYGLVAITPYSNSSHYDDLSVMISDLDGEPFDGFWCPVRDIDDCNRGPMLDKFDMTRLMSARTATISVFQDGDDRDTAELVSEIEVDLRQLKEAAARSFDFEAEIWGMDSADALPETNHCYVTINGKKEKIVYAYDEDDDIEKQSLREILLGPKGETTCPSYVTLAYLTPDSTSAQRELFCLALDEDETTVLGIQQGAQNAYRVCKKPSRSFCERVNDSKSAALGITGLASGAVGSAVGTTAATGTTVVMHSSGAAIITGSSGYVAGTLGTIGASALGILTAPATVTAAAVSVIAVGGSVYYCSE